MNNSSTNSRIIHPPIQSTDSTHRCDLVLVLVGAEIGADVVAHAEHPDGVVANADGKLF